VGYVSVDLDPNATQKVEAFRIFDKFPALRKELDLQDTDDLRRWIFERVQEDGACADLDYASDVEPWIGERVAVAAVPGEDRELTPMVALQVSDVDAGRSGLEALAACEGPGGDGSDAGGKATGLAFVGDYAVVTETQAIAERIAADAEQAPLTDDEQFQQITAAAGDPGIITVYASAEAPGYLMDLQESLMGPMMGPFSGPMAGTETATGSAGAEELAAQATGTSAGAAGAVTAADEDDPMSDRMREMYADFEGMAGVVRFRDGAVEAEFSARGLPVTFPAGTAGAGDAVGALPAETGAAVSVSLPDGWLQDYLEQMAAMSGEEVSVEEGMAELEKMTGLSLPEDLETLLGDNVTVALGASADFEALAGSEDLSGLPAGIRVSGNPDEIIPIVEKLRAAVGPAADQLVVESGDGVVAFGFSRDYVQSLLTEGGLGDVEAFSGVVPSPDDAASVVFVNFDAGDGWIERLAGDADPQAGENIAPLDALGISGSTDSDGSQHGLFRLTTD
jgi:hypothetical protein